MSLDEKDKENCKACGAIIYWTSTDTGARMPVNPDGSNHFRGSKQYRPCPGANQFRGHKDESQGDPGAFKRSSMSENQCFFNLKESNEYRLRMKKNKK